MYFLCFFFLILYVTLTIQTTEQLKYVFAYAVSLRPRYDWV